MGYVGHPGKPCRPLRAPNHLERKGLGHTGNSKEVCREGKTPGNRPRGLSVYAKLRLRAALLRLLRLLPVLSA